MSNAGGVTLLNADCRTALKGYQDNSIDSCVTDPPYALVSITKRFGKPNSAPARDGDVYARSSAGFMGQQWDTGEVSFSAEFWAEVYRVLKPGGFVLSFGGTRTYHRIACAIEDAGFEVRDQIGWLYGSGFPKSHNQKDEWEGFGTALKPAWEPICMARKPLIGTVRANLDEHGTGAINIAGCRVPFTSDADESESKTKNRHAEFGSGPMTNQVFGKFDKDRDNYDPEGRWPANVIHDGSDEVIEAFPSPGEKSEARFFYTSKATKADREQGLNDLPDSVLAMSNQAKAELERGEMHKAESGMNTAKVRKNNHPTVKPTSLMRYLCRLVTPPGGTVLDPFMGSGSTGKAAVLEGFGFIGIEREEKYMPIAIGRVRWAQDHVGEPEEPLEKPRKPKPANDNQTDLEDYLNDTRSAVPANG